MPQSLPRQEGHRREGGREYRHKAGALRQEDAISQVFDPNRWIIRFYHRRGWSSPHIPASPVDGVVSG